jgi:hypothetical protein
VRRAGGAQDARGVHDALERPAARTRGEGLRVAQVHRHRLKRACSSAGGATSKPQPASRREQARATARPMPELLP